MTVIYHFIASASVFPFVESEQSQFGDCVWYGWMNFHLLEVPQVNTATETQIAPSKISYNSKDDLIKYELKKVIHFNGGKGPLIPIFTLSSFWEDQISSKRIVFFSRPFRLSINMISAFWNSSFFHLPMDFQTAFSIWITHEINSMIFCKCKLPFDCYSSFL